MLRLCPKLVTESNFPGPSIPNIGFSCTLMHVPQRSAVVHIPRTSQNALRFKFVSILEFDRDRFIQALCIVLTGVSHGIAAGRISRLHSSLHIADLDDTVGGMRMHRRVYAAGHFDANQPQEIVFKLYGVVRGIHIYSVWHSRLRGNGEASSGLQMIECLSVLQMKQN